MPRRRFYYCPVVLDRWGEVIKSAVFRDPEEASPACYRTRRTAESVAAQAAFMSVGSGVGSGEIYRPALARERRAQRRLVAVVADGAGQVVRRYGVERR